MSAIAHGMILIAYLCGSISSAILVCRLCGLPDPRTSGSGNPCATNVLRIGGKGSRSSTDFRRSERNVARLGRV